MFSPRFNIGQSTDPMAKDFFVIIQKIGKPILVKKKQAIIRKGSFPSFFFFVQEGIFKTSISINNKEVVLGFTFKGDVDGCPVSLLSKQPNDYNIQAVTEGQILVCELADFYSNCTDSQSLLFINLILTNYLRVLEKRVLDAISLTAEERYKLLLIQQPNQIKQIPLTYIAGYLGISIERLSRLRKKLKI